MILGAIFLTLVIAGGCGIYARHVTSRVAAVGSPRAARTARGAQRQAARAGSAVSGRAGEIWAEAQSTAWLEKQRVKLARRGARPTITQTASRARQHAATAAGGIRSAGAAGVRRVRSARPLERVTVVSGTIPPLAPTGTDGVVPFPAGGRSGTPAPRPAPRPEPLPARPASEPTERTAPQMTTTTDTPAGNGASGTSTGGGADLFTAMQQVTGHAMSGGLRSKQRSISVLSDSFDYMAAQLDSFARQLSEPGQNYPPAVWEGLSRAAAHLKAASSCSGESSSSISAIASMTVGELADSPVRAPHHDELNAAR